MRGSGGERWIGSELLFLCVQFKLNQMKSPIFGHSWAVKWQFHMVQTLGHLFQSLLGPWSHEVRIYGSEAQ